MNIYYCLFLTSIVIAAMLISYRLSKKSFCYAVAYILTVAFFAHATSLGRPYNCSDVPLRILPVVTFLSLSAFYYAENRDKKMIIMVIFCFFVSFLSAYIYEYNSLHGLQIYSVSRKCEYDDNQQKLEDDISFVEIINNNPYPVYIDHIYLSDGTYWNDYSFSDFVVYDRFKLEMEVNEGIELSKHNSTTISLNLSATDTIDEIEVPGLFKNEVYYSCDGSIASLSPSKKIAGPSLSCDGGYYDDPFYLEIKSEEGYEIFYTVDGSDPDEGSLRYESPIYIYDRSNEDNVYRNIPYVIKNYENFTAPEKVDKIFVVRAVCIDGSGNCSDILTSSYIVGLPEYRDRRVISLVSDPYNLFDPEDGIYVVGKDYMDWYESGGGDQIPPEVRLNYAIRGRDTERNANIEMFNISDKPINQRVGIRVRGNSSADNPLKRFSVFCRKEYSGSPYFDGPVLGSNKTHSIIIRNGLDNALANALVSGKDLAHANTVPVSVFIDGEFWYDTFIADKMNEHFFEDKYGVYRDNVLIAENGVYDGYNFEDGLLNFNVLLFLSENDIAKEEVYEELNKMIDIQSYIDYQCTNIYLGNHDYSETWNTRAWRVAIPEDDGYGDGRWRWMLYDMDLWRTSATENNSLSRTAEINSFLMVREEWGPEKAIYYQPIFSYLVWNKTFVKDFINTFMDLINTDFAVSRVETILAEWGEDISYDDYFYRDRAEYITKYMEEIFELEGTQEDVCIKTNGSFDSVKINSVVPDLSADWNGKYYTDYPITLTATSDGFDHWVINGDIIEGTSISVDVPVGGLEVVAVYE